MKLWMKRTIFFCWMIPVSLLPACRTTLSPQEEEDAQYITEHASRLFQEGKGTQYEYASNAICQNMDSMRILRGLQTGDRAAVVRKLADCRRKLRQGMAWNVHLPEQEIPYMVHAPIPDGKISMREREEALAFHGEHPLGETQKDSRFPDSLWLIGWNGEMLYVAVSFRDEKPELRHGKNGSPKGSELYLGDCLEFFLRPQIQKLPYFECLMNPAGEFWMLSHLPGYWGGFSPIDRECPAPGAIVKGSMHDGFYTIEALLPFRIWHGAWCSRAPRPGDRFSFMMLRTNRNGASYTVSTPVPFLYSGHNLYGYLRGILAPPPADGGLGVSPAGTSSGFRKPGFPVSQISE